MRFVAMLVGVALGCSVPDVDVTEKGCPCVEGFICVESTGECVPEEAVGYDPSNLQPVDLLRGDTDVTVLPETRWVIDTDALTVKTADGDDVALPEGARLAQVAQAEAPSIAVLFVSQLVVEEGAELWAVGSLPMAIVARMGIVVDGLLSVGADGPFTRRQPGAGGAPGASSSHSDGHGAGAGSNGIPDADVAPCVVNGSPVDPCDSDACPDVTGGGGGGGAGYGSAGGTGGGGTRVGGSSGDTYGSESLIPLRGGSGGGAGGAGSGTGCGGFPTGGEGGHGGGALQLSAGIFVRIGGVIQARGGGGRGGKLPERDDGSDYHHGSGGGGGSGGAILIEAPQVEIEGQVSANGGAGGDPALDGQEGADGEAGIVGGIATSPGAGGAGNDGPDAGEPGDTVGNVGGGGGAGAGRIRINTADGRAFERGVGAVHSFGRIQPSS